MAENDENSGDLLLDAHCETVGPNSISTIIIAVVAFKGTTGKNNPDGTFTVEHKIEIRMLPNEYGIEVSAEGFLPVVIGLTEALWAGLQLPLLPANGATAWGCRRANNPVKLSGSLNGSQVTLRVGPVHIRRLRMGTLV